MEVSELGVEFNGACSLFKFQIDMFLGYNTVEFGTSAIELEMGYHLFQPF